MKLLQIVALINLIGLSIMTLVITSEVRDYKEHNERFDALVRDSVKMHKIYENYMLNYSDRKKLED